MHITFAITPFDGSCYRLIASSNIEEFLFFVSKCLSCNEEKSLELRKDNKI